MQHAAVPPRLKIAPSATARCRANATAMRRATARSTCARPQFTRPLATIFHFCAGRGRAGQATGRPRGGAGHALYGHYERRAGVPPPPAAPQPSCGRAQAAPLPTPAREPRRLLVVVVLVLKAPGLYELFLELVGLLVVEARAAVLMGRHDDHSLELVLYLVQVDPWALAHARAPMPATYNAWAARAARAAAGPSRRQGAGCAAPAGAAQKSFN